MRHAKFSIALLLVMTFTHTGESQDKTRATVPPNLIFELLALNRDIPVAARPKYLSPTDLVASPDGSQLFIAEQTAKRIAVISTATNTVTQKIQLPNEVTGLAVNSDGTLLYATCSSELWPSGIVCEVSVSGGKVVRQIAVGHSARSPVLSPDGSVLYVCNTFDNDISVVDVAGGRETKRIAVVREPFIARITNDGSVLVVANSLPNEKATDTLNISCKISLIQTATGTITANIPLTIGSHSVFGLTISPDGAYAFATHLIGMFNLPAIIITNGWIHTNNVAVIDIAGKKLLNDLTLDYSEQGAANPWGIACTDDGAFLCIAHSGSNELSIIDMPKLINEAKSTEYLSRKFSILYPNTIRRRVPVKGKAPRALTIIGDKVYTAGYFSDSVEVFDISLSTRTSSAQIALGEPLPMTSERKGEYRFYDASLCLQGWQSCHSCHPFARPDAMNWILQGGNNTPKNAKSMLYSWWTPPTSWAGRRRNAYESIRSGIQAELFLQPDEKLAVDLDTFFMKMKPVPSPHLEKGQLSESARRGREIYYSNKVDCKLCHPAPLFTDNVSRDAGFADPFDANRNWVTPHLIEAWRTAPYNHLGSHDKLEDCLKQSTHSNAGRLSAGEFNDLMEYVLSL